SIISSPSESFSLTIAESLAHGCPVVGFNVPYGPQELIESGVNGYLVEFKETDAMAERIIQIMKDPSLQRELSNNARESSKRFSESTVKDLWVKLFQNICPEFKFSIQPQVLI
ncbi:MAG: glycosyltransferase, partial [Alcaligenaceae bacterium]|nr:glycosyltransferase [Alcaligenaceae bacterium]